MTRAARLLLLAAATDATFVVKQVAGERVLVGKCLHCGSKLVVSTRGSTLSTGTVEHILPRAHGGADDVENLAVACARCNAEKGVRHDPKGLSDPGLAALVASLRSKRAARMREIPPEIAGLVHRGSGLGEPPRRASKRARSRREKLR